MVDAKNATSIIGNHRDDFTERRIKTMKFVKVNSIPNFNKGRKGSVQTFIEEFYNSGIKMAKIDIEEGRYKSLKHAQNTFLSRNRSLGKLPVKTIIRGNEIYIVRTDM